jgi:DNA adenine methylase
MILRRQGNKSKLADNIIQYFPFHSIYIEPFFGAGGMFFNKPKVKYNIVNDIDSDVFNLFQVVSNQKEELEKAFFEMPIHADLLEYWKTNKETDPIRKALRFLLLSNFTFNGAGTMVVYGASSSRATSYKNDFYDKLNQCNRLLFDVQFTNHDFRKFFNSIMLDDRSDEREKSFIYADKPYSDTGNNYSNDWTAQDDIDLLEVLGSTNIKYAVSEFEGSHFEDLALKKGLNKIVIGERQNLKNRRVEILLRNYHCENRLFNN